MTLSKEDIQKYGTEEEKKILENKKYSISNPSFSNQIEEELLSKDIQREKDRVCAKDDMNKKTCFDYGFRMGFEKGFREAMAKWY